MVVALLRSSFLGGWFSALQKTALNKPQPAFCMLVGDLPDAEVKLWLAMPVFRFFEGKSCIWRISRNRRRRVLV